MDVSQTPYAIRRRTEILALVALATVFELVLFVLDSAIPKPVPWIKLGLANIITLALLVCVGWRVALSVHLMRIVIGAIFWGGLFSPFFLLSFSGGIVSFLVMAQAARWIMPALGFLGVSILGVWARGSQKPRKAYWLSVACPVVSVLWQEEAGLEVPQAT